MTATLDEVGPTLGALAPTTGGRGMLLRHRPYAPGMKRDEAIANLRRLLPTIQPFQGGEILSFQIGVKLK